MPAPKQVSDLLFFDNLALHYVASETPPTVLARVFNSADARLAGSFLGLFTPKQREAIHALMAQAKQDDDAKKNEEAAGALLIVAEGLMARGLIRNKGRHFFGVPKEEQAS